jgi:hypothetical protein
MGRTAQARRRLLGALAFSLVVTAVVGLSTVPLSHAPSSDDVAYIQGWLTACLGLAAVFSVWVLVAALLDVRPAWADSLGRWVWVWTMLSCAALLAAGITHSSGESLASVLLYASGWLSAISGAIGLVFAAIPPRAERDFYGRPM